jgi:hypothetical protein
MAGGWDRTRRPSPTNHRRSQRAGSINLTDPDVKGLRGFIQGYNAQAVTTEDQVVIAAK